MIIARLEIFRYGRQFPVNKTILCVGNCCNTNYGAAKPAAWSYAVEEEMEFQQQNLQSPSTSTCSLLICSLPAVFVLQWCLTNWWLLSSLPYHQSERNFRDLQFWFHELPINLILLNQNLLFILFGSIAFSIWVLFYNVVPKMPNESFTDMFINVFGPVNLYVYVSYSQIYQIR